LKKILKWVKNHVRPHFRYNPKEGEEIDIFKDRFTEARKKLKDQLEAGIKFTFKF